MTATQDRHQVNLETAYKETESKLQSLPIYLGNNTFVGQIPECVGNHSFTFRKVERDNRCKKILYYDYNARKTSAAIANFVQNFERTIESQQSYENRAEFPFTIYEYTIRSNNSIQIDLDWIHRPKQDADANRVLFQGYKN